MSNLFDILKKYNCLDICVRISGSVTLTVVGDYDGETYTKPLPFSDFVYIDDFPPLMDAVAEFANGSNDRLYTHFRMEHDGALHWAYLCCHKTAEFGRFDGVILDVYEYVDSIPNDSVISEFERKRGSKITGLNNNSASLLEICGMDYLLRIQKPFAENPKLYTAIIDENEKLICTPCFTEKREYKFSSKAAIRFSFRVGAYWYLGSDDKQAFNAAESYMKGLADCLSSIAHSIIALYNETENSNAVNRQLGANVEQQMLINGMQAVIMEEARAKDALTRILEMACRYLNIDGIVSFGTYSSNVPEELCRFEIPGSGASDTYPYIKERYHLVQKSMESIDNYFSGENEIHFKDIGLTGFAISKIDDNNGVSGLIIYVIKHGNYSWEYNNRKMIRSISQVISSVIFRCRSEQQIEEKNRQLYNLAFFDSMLGIKNRARLDIDITDIIRAGGSGAAMAMQIINTRFLNEVFGQSYTDKLLRMVAQFLSSPDIGGENVYRYSGSIIMIVAKDKTADEAQAITKRIIERIREPFIIDGIEQFAETAIGIAVYNSSTVSAENLYRAATLSLYRANEYGKNTFAFYHREFLDSKGDVYNLESELRRCIADNMRNFEVTFQPVFNMNGVICHYETLLRWTSETMGKISPKIFMRMMEKVGLDTPIDLWVLPRACDFCMKVRNATGKNIKVGVNLTTHEMQTGALPDRFRTELEQRGISGDALIAEVPEAAHVLSYNDTASTLGRLKKLGVSICIDSFGNEYLPLNVLKNSYVDMIKVSSSFVTNSGGEFDDVLLSTTFSLAASRNIITCVKNIEYKSQYDAAKHAGAAMMQGGFLALPVTAEEILSDLKNGLPSFEVI